MNESGSSSVSLNKEPIREIKFGIIGGSGFTKSLFEGTQRNITTKYGAASIIESQFEGHDVVFLSRHGAGHKISPHKINHKANILALAEMGVTHVLATAAVGSLRTDMAPGEFVIIDDFVDMTQNGVITFFEDEGSVVHTDFSDPYDRELRGHLIAAAADIDINGNHAIDHAIVHPAGAYLCLSGPRYETPAEVRLFAQWGCDLVGMTGSPEAILCREAKLAYASIAIITNYACGLVNSAPLSHEEVEEQMRSSIKYVSRLITTTISRMYNER